jgi:hypothetical protein
MPEMNRSRIAVLTLALAGLACGPLTTSTAPQPAASPMPPLLATAEPTPLAAEPTAMAPGPEAILILTPGSGSHLVNRVHVEGEAAPTFEQTIVVEVVALEGETPQVLAQQPVTIQSEAGQRGAFAADLTFALADGAAQAGAVRVYSVSARDGGITHLASSQVTLDSAGDESILASPPHPEQIAVISPTAGAVVTGGRIHIEGVAVASFEQTLLVELLDADGAVIASAPVIVAAPDYGIPGPFAIDLAYPVDRVGPARVAVRDVSPAFGQDLHLSSVDVQLEP